jgi:hypothetical protein
MQIAGRFFAQATFDPATMFAPQLQLLENRAVMTR